MRIAIHQPHYFPWLGYFDKMAKADKFVVLDEVQMPSKSYMSRNRFLDSSGGIKLLSVTVSKKGYQDKKYNEIETFNNQAWQRKHSAFLESNYLRSPYFGEVFDRVQRIFERDYKKLFYVAMDSINAIRDMLGIDTEIIVQSRLEHEKGGGKNDLVLELCKRLGATHYLSGKGYSLEFIDSEKFLENGISVSFQEFAHPVYRQLHNKEFVSGISALDMLLNCGIEESREIFWRNVYGE